MFKKAFKVKSNNEIRSSEKKKLQKLFSTEFPNLTEDNIDGIFPSRASIALLKVETSAGKIVEIYTVDKTPVGFIHEGRLFPSIQLLWDYPNMLLNLTTIKEVLFKLLNGANLLLPGVLNSSTEFPEFAKGSPAYINLDTNKAAVAVGVTAYSSADMLKMQGKGKCIIVHHIVGDKLCELGDAFIIPTLGRPDCLNKSKVTSDSESTDMLPFDSVEETFDFVIRGLKIDTICDMNDAILKAFFTAITVNRAVITLPVLTSTFYKRHMVKALLSDNVVVDIKKSTYKKLSVFLQDMVALNIISVEEQKKGVYAITDINFEHDLVKRYNFHSSLILQHQSNSLLNKEIEVLEGHMVTTKAAPMFVNMGFKRGDIMRESEVEILAMEYADKHSLVYSKERIDTNPLLRFVLDTQAQFLPRAVFCEKIIATMSPCVEITCNGKKVIHKGKLEPIAITVARRASNKKVTLVDNLTPFGINIEDLASHCQKCVGASTSINKCENTKKTDQLLIQGNHVSFIYHLLIGTYKVPKKYVTGLEFASKKKH